MDKRNRLRKLGALVVLTVAPLLSPQTADASVIAEISLADMAQQANAIVRGYLAGVREEKVEVGGGQLNALVYTFDVTEILKGVESEKKTYEFRMLGSLRAFRQGFFGDGFPRFREGAEYVIFVNKPSRVGLTSPVGLAAGAFEIRSIDGTEVVQNGFDNAGLLDMATEAAIQDATGAQLNAVSSSALTYATLRSVVVSTESR